MSLSNNFPAIRPSLLLDFANTTSLDPRITFTRASTATYYDGLTVAKAEENLVIYSQEFDFAGNWLLNNALITANSTTAPDGTSTADSLIESAATGGHFVFSGFTSVSGLSYTYSVFAKASTRSWLQLATQSGVSTTAWANFDLTNGVVGATGAGITGSSITNVGNGWYRCSMTILASAAGTAGIVIAVIDANTASRLPSYAGNGTSGIFIWGAQLEQRSSVTAYTATTTQPIINYIPVLLTAPANTARFEHNPTTGESLGLEIEESRTNSALNSASFTGSTGTENILNSAISPTGEQDADFIYETTTTGEHFAGDRSISVTSGVVYTWSFYCKQGVGNRLVRIRTATSGAATADLDLSTGVIINPGGAAYVNSTVQAVGNGWYRVSLTITASATGTLVCRAQLVSAVDGTVYTGNGYSGFFLWGAQLEAGTFPTSYIATGGSQVTRSADSAVMTGTNFSSWYRTNEGTIYAESILNGANTNKDLLTITDGTSANEITMRWASGAQAQALVVAGNVTQVSIAPSGYSTIGTAYKRVFAFKVNDFEQAINGTSVGTDISGVLPAVDRLQFMTPSGNASLNGTIRKVAYYPLRLTRAQLEALTSA